MSTAAPLPTRVNRACGRCRRNKSRCDSYRPCSLCLRANAVCETDGDSSGNARQSLPGDSRQIPTSISRQSLPAISRTATGVSNSSARSPRESSPQLKRRRRDTTPSAIVRRVSLDGPNTASDRPTLNSIASQSPHDSERFHGGGGDSAIDLAQRIHTLQRMPTHDEHVIDAIPGLSTDFHINEPTTANSAPIASYVAHPLPDHATILSLLGDYFDSVHWFSLVILEPKFRSSLETLRAGFATPGQEPFLLLLSTILGISAWYRAHKISAKDSPDHQYWADWSRKMIMNSESQLVNIMDQRSVIAVQIMILLGSFYVYHGRPNLSFSLLGATVKAAQSLGIHQASPGAPHLDVEERKRVWWTIYTWDRFASITYGRPLGINEKSCNVGKPQDVYETPISGRSAQHENLQPICYSAYQRELNSVYQIASPAIESVYAIAPGEQHQKTAQVYYAQVHQVTIRLWHWRTQLPEHLRLDLDQDWPMNMSAEDKAHRLQSLSLYLTFDSLILILHRPFMKQRLDSFLESESPAYARTHEGSEVSIDSFRQLPKHPDANDVSSHEQLWSAAVRTSKVIELPQLAQHATDGHLINFLAINLFNAAVVLIVMALSDPLADRAQEAKRAVARIYRLQVTLGGRSMLSQQSSGVLKSLIQLLITHESNAILAPVAPSVPTGQERGSDNHTLESQPLSVGDALRLPLWSHFGLEEDHSGMAPPPQDIVGGRLDYSLESVQRAFTGGPLPLPGQASSGVPSRRDSQTYNTDAQFTNPMPSEAFGDGLDWRTTDLGSMENGMHWIWDPAWDNLFKQTNSS